MLKLTSSELSAADKTLKRRAEIFLPPEILMKIECAADAERDADARAALYEAWQNAVDCGLTEKTLTAAPDRAHIFIYAGERPRLVYLPLLDDYEKYTSLTAFTAHPGELPEVLAGIIREIGAPAPLFIGAGLADSDARAVFLARLALSRIGGGKPLDAERERLRLRCLRAARAALRDSGAALGDSGALDIRVESGGTISRLAVVFSPITLRRAELTL